MLCCLANNVHGSFMIGAHIYRLRKKILLNKHHTTNITPPYRVKEHGDDRGGAGAQPGEGVDKRRRRRGRQREPALLEDGQGHGAEHVLRGGRAAVREQRPGPQVAVLDGDDGAVQPERRERGRQAPQHRVQARDGQLPGLGVGFANRGIVHRQRAGGGAQRHLQVTQARGKERQRAGRDQARG